MGDKTKIEWSDATWNPVTGCTKVSPGCDRCYAETIAHRFAGTKAYPNGFDVTLRSERLDQPLRWVRPRRVFVNSTSDLFHDDVPEEFIGQVFAVMALAKQHTFQILTKRHARMRSLLRKSGFRVAVENAITGLDLRGLSDRTLRQLARRESAWVPLVSSWPLPNVWLGVSAEDQQWADIRIPALLETPAAVRFISAEPLLGPLDARFSHCPTHDFSGGMCTWSCPQRYGLDWVIAGGESGHGARPMHPDWVRGLRDQCAASGIAFHFKQRGEWTWSHYGELPQLASHWVSHTDGRVLDHREALTATAAGDYFAGVWRVGKKTAGRELDGRTWDEFPQVARS